MTQSSGVSPAASTSSILPFTLSFATVNLPVSIKKDGERANAPRRKAGTPRGVPVEFHWTH
jgi:hypothetical protein